MNKLMVRVMNAVSAPPRSNDDDRDRGGVAAEYGVLLAGVVAVVAVAAAALGGRISDLFDTILP